MIPTRNLSGVFFKAFVDSKLGILGSGVVNPSITLGMPSGNTLR